MTFICLNVPQYNTGGFKSYPHSVLWEYSMGHEYMECSHRSTPVPPNRLRHPQTDPQSLMYPQTDPGTSKPMQVGGKNTAMFFIYEAQ